MTTEERNQRHEDCKNEHRGDENGHFFNSSRQKKFHCGHCGEFCSTRESNRRWFGKCNEAGHSSFCQKANR